MRMTAAAVICAAQASVAQTAPVTVLPGTLEDVMVRFLEARGCTAHEDEIFHELMARGATIGGAHEVMLIWRDKGWLVTDETETYTLKGVGKCR